MRIGFTHTRSLRDLAAEYHRALPGFIRAALVDHGVSAEVVDRRAVGWDGEFITVPVTDGVGRVAFFERWSPLAVGVAVDDELPVELYPRDVLDARPGRVLIAEGVHEALVLESEGFAAVAATGTGRTFKAREWSGLFAGVPDVVIAYRRGECRGGRYTPSRSDVFAEAAQAVPHARRLEWPVERNGGARLFFVDRGHTRADLEALLAW